MAIIAAHKHTLSEATELVYSNEKLIPTKLKTNMIEASLLEISNHPDYKILKRIPEVLTQTKTPTDKIFIATIVDLETMGLDATKNEIIEIGLLSFAFTTTDGIIEVTDTYNALNDPGKPIPEEVTKVTGIRDEDVRGKSIDWDTVGQRFQKSHLIICHNSGFDRNFLELQTPKNIQAIIEPRPFACTIKDIDWQERGFESAKLDYLNWKLGFFYDGHRALVDCWATMNLFLQEAGSFDELKANVRKKQTLICAENAPFDKKDLLKVRKYRWSDGSDKLPKSWWTVVDNELLADEKTWLDDEIYGRSGKGDDLPQLEITAHKRYSYRAELLD